MLYLIINKGSMRILQAISLYLILGIVCTLGKNIMNSTPLKPIQSKVANKSFLEPQTNAVSELCSPYANRSQLVNQYDLNVARGYITLINSTLKIDGLSVMKLIAKGEGSAAWDQINNNLTNLILFIASFAVGLVVLLLTWPFLLCCCLCSCCTSRRSKGTQNALLIFFFIGLLLAVGTCIYGLVQTLDIGNAIRKTGCSAAIIPNDLLYGNKTNDGKSFYSGFYQITNQIVDLQANLGNISSQFAILNPGSPDKTMDNALQLIQTAKSNTVKISNNDAIGSDLVLSYPAPINESIALQNIPSFFPQFLGSYSSQSGLVWGIYQVLDNLDVILQNLRQNTIEYDNELTNLNTGIGQIKSQTQFIIQDLNDSQTTLQGYLSSVQNFITYSDISFKTFYGVVIGLSAIALLSACFTTKCNCCRFMVPLSCVLLFFAALIGFIISVTLTIALPPLTWSCAFVQDSLKSEASFQSNFDFLIDQKTLSQISVCMPYGNGDIVSKIGIDAVAGLNNLTQVIKTLNTFQIDQYKGPILENLQIGIEAITDFAQSRIIDISDTQNLALLAKIANPTLYNYQHCFDLLKNDSWVPSNHPNTAYQKDYIPCSSTIGKSGDQLTCPNGITNVDSCTGCMDSGSLSNYYYRNPSAVLLDDLNTRYNTTCTFNDQLNNIWKNYYLVKANALGPDVQGVPSTSGVLPRLITTKGDIDLLVSTIDPALPTIFKNILTDLNDIDNIIDPNYGLIAGLNCKLMGQDFQRLEQAICGSIYTNIYTARLVLGIASYGILLALFIAVPLGKKLVGSRRFQDPQLIRQQSRILLDQEPQAIQSESVQGNEVPSNRAAEGRRGADRIAPNGPVYFVFENSEGRRQSLRLV